MGRGQSCTTETVDLLPVMRIGVGLDERSIPPSIAQLLEHLSEGRMRWGAFDSERNGDALSALWLAQDTLLPQLARSDPEQYQAVMTKIAFFGRRSWQSDDPRDWIVEALRDLRTFQNLSPLIARIPSRGRQRVHHLRTTATDTEALCGATVASDRQPLLISSFKASPCKRCLQAVAKLKDGEHEELRGLADLERRSVSDEVTAAIIEAATAAATDYMRKPSPELLGQFASGLRDAIASSLHEEMAKAGAADLYRLQPKQRLQRLTYPYNNCGQHYSHMKPSPCAEMYLAILASYGDPDDPGFWPSEEETASHLRDLLRLRDEFAGSPWEEHALGHLYARLFPRAVTHYLRTQPSHDLKGNPVLTVWRDHYQQLVPEAVAEDLYAALPV